MPRGAGGWRTEKRREGRDTHLPVLRVIPNLLLLGFSITGLHHRALPLLEKLHEATTLLDVSELSLSFCQLSTAEGSCCTSSILDDGGIHQLGKTQCAPTSL